MKQLELPFKEANNETVETKSNLISTLQRLAKLAAAGDEDAREFYLEILEAKGE